MYNFLNTFKGQKFSKYDVHDENIRFYNIFSKINQMFY